MGEVRKLDNKMQMIYTLVWSSITLRTSGAGEIQFGTIGVKMATGPKHFYCRKMAGIEMIAISMLIVNKSIVYVPWKFGLSCIHFTREIFTTGTHTHTHSFPLLARFLCRKTNKERTTKEQMRRDRHKRKLIVSVLLGIGSMECCVWMCMAERKCVFLWGDLFVMSVSKSSARWMKWLLTLRWNFGTSPF